MLRLNALLAVLLVLCALFVVTARHQARKSFIELQAQQEKARGLDIEWGRLQLEQSTWAMHARIEQVARQHLQMAVPEPKQIHRLNLMHGGAQ
ncbi:cell division protein FtsL [Sulfuritortus calidifontis]|uniref:Cell division protein FtsL n=1 Tax=Sulfuritortus calidifontis TaxID=1914471 RepID=A0A4R3JTX6_9PROT|nr:cell division protein FtsL [Sulfuritortus calidifontis]TCS71042.1 cell division protein FtsL [Sulfuritortus calidifontis]